MNKLIAVWGMANYLQGQQIKTWFYLNRYTSKFRHMVKEEYTSGRGKYRTMGLAKEPVPSTDDFLKKHEKEPVLPTSESYITWRWFEYVFLVSAYFILLYGCLVHA